ncbi:hypothetical protein BUZ27_06240 [Staphylococcus haemolyticus]|uniref:hypothetical protein n=1 Tax=Staphylococcus haemolyticus TaxID=1283 RepID=UPI000D1DE53A|nr:hypothetical protein [Staphylococcus haemolyticus]PTK42117.1 hypothetical protein BUZ38_01060 [Staphylococcus haemolyticus]PTK77169.1 hypothetical protein BUZ27_06240 [Staphylococcus haemolyticus]
MTNQLDTLIAISKEYTRLLEKRKELKEVGTSRYISTTEISTARIKRTGLMLRQTMIDFEKGSIDND